MKPAISRPVWSTLSVVSLCVAGLACGGTPAPGGKPKPGTPGGPGSPGSPGTTTGMPGAGGAKGGGMTPGGMPMGMNMGTGGAIPIGIPTSGTLSTIYPGGGVTGSTPLMPGCTPASAKECPSATGTCATSATANPKNVSTGYICYYPTSTSTTSGAAGGKTPTGGTPAATTTTITTTPEATVEYIHESAGGQEYYHFRITFDPSFVDNTYGVNAIGWGTRGHTFKDLVGSDHAQLSLFDAGKTMVSQFNLDYITADSSAACGYGCLGVSGGEGGMLVGDAKYILAATTSLDRDLNGCGYCKSAACNGDCTVDSPATDKLYTPSASTPKWDYRVVYEVWVAAGVFGSNGFGGASITFVHASPSKASSNTVTVEPKPCGSCPEGYSSYLTSEGAVCVPTGSHPDGGASDGGSCPAGYVSYLTSEGASCVPVAQPPAGGGGGCGAGLVSYETAKGSTTCVPVPTDGGCAAGTRLYYLPTESAVCVPTPTDGSCPAGFSLGQSSEGPVCL